MGDGTRFLLGEDSAPDRRYKLVADLPATLPPPFHPGRLDLVKLGDHAPVVLMAMMQLDGSAERYVPIADDILDT